MNLARTDCTVYEWKRCVSKVDHRSRLRVTTLCLFLPFLHSFFRAIWELLRNAFCAITFTALLIIRCKVNWNVSLNCNNSIFKASFAKKELKRSQETNSFSFISTWHSNSTLSNDMFKQHIKIMLKETVMCLISGIMRYEYEMDRVHEGILNANKTLKVTLKDAKKKKLYNWKWQKLMKVSGDGWKKFLHPEIIIIHEIYSNYDVSYRDRSLQLQLHTSLSPDEFSTLNAWEAKPCGRSGHHIKVSCKFISNYFDIYWWIMRLKRILVSFLIQLSWRHNATMLRKLLRQTWNQNHNNSHCWSE